MKQSTPPLLRGIGTVLVLVAAVIAVQIARLPPSLPSPTSPTSTTSTTSPTARPPTSGGTLTPVAPLGSIVAGRGPEAALDGDGDGDTVEQVLENAWFEWISIAGTATIAASFFAEAWLRRTVK